MDLQFILYIDAYITSATMLINGSTIHSIIGFLVNNLMNPNVYDYLFMYEVSMVGCNMVVVIHLKLKNVKSQHFFLHRFKYFMGNFMQFPLINDYSYILGICN
jgi:hypothetical protein